MIFNRQYYLVNFYYFFFVFLLIKRGPLRTNAAWFTILHHTLSYEFSAVLYVDSKSFNYRLCHGLLRGVFLFNLVLNPILNLLPSALETRLSFDVDFLFTEATTLGRLNGFRKLVLYLILHSLVAVQVRHDTFYLTIFIRISFSSSLFVEAHGLRRVLRYVYFQLFRVSVFEFRNYQTHSNFVLLQHCWLSSLRDLSLVDV